MNTIDLKSNSLENIFQQLHRQLDAKLSFESSAYAIQFENKQGYGNIVGMQLKDGISFLEFHVNFKEDTQVVIGNTLENVIHFAYCTEGEIIHQFDTNKVKKRLETFQTGILSNIESQKNILHFKGGRAANVMLISVNCYGSKTENSLQTQLYNTFIADRTEDYLFIGSYNLKIAERIKQLRSIKQEGVVRNLIYKGLVNIILALEIQQHENDLMRAKNDFGNLTAEEMVGIKDLSDFIKNYPETELTVSELSRKVGLAPAKLQEGFKRMHDKTVNDFIRDERIKKSEILIKTTDMNISQIVYTIGFSSRSYFSKIFKEKYNCSPNMYKAKNRLAATA